MVSPPGGARTPAPVVLTRWPIYVRDWLGSDTLRALCGDAEMLFVRMCLDQWEHGVCSPDEERWRSAHAHRCADWSRAWRQASALFTRSDTGLVNARVARDRERSAGEISAKVRAAVETNAKRAAKPRKAKKADRDAERTLSVTHSERSPDAHPTLKPPSASASASSSESDQTPLPPGPDRVRQTKARLAGKEPDLTRSEAWKQAPAGLGEKPPIAAARRRVKPPDVDPLTVEMPPEINRPDVRAALVAFLAARVEKGHGGWGPSLAQTRLEELASWGPERAIAALKHSAGYQGVFEPRNGQANGKAYQHAFEKTGDAIDQVFGALRSRERTVDVETVRRGAIGP